MSTVRSFQYSYQSKNSEQSEENTNPLGKMPFILKGSSSRLTVREKEVIKVNVQWDGFEESFELHNEGELFNQARLAHKNVQETKQAL